MKLIFETNSGTSFEIEVENSDTLLLVKQKIEKSQNIPVSEQVLVVDGAFILRDDLNVEQCKIFQESHLHVLVFPEDNQNDQVLQPEKSTAPFISVEEYFAIQDWPLTVQEITKIYRYRPVTVKSEESPPSQTQFKRINTNVQDSPMNNIAVRVSLPDLAQIFLLCVNKTDHVGTLRTLIRNANGLGDQTRLQDGYFLMHKERVLCEDVSFQLNGIGHFNKIEIVPVP